MTYRVVGEIPGIPPGEQVFGPYRWRWVAWVVAWWYVDIAREGYGVAWIQKREQA